MHYGALNILLGLGFAVQAYFYPRLAFPWMWLGTSFFALGLAYLYRRPGLLGKAPDGSIRWWSWAAFLPLHVFLHAVWHLARLCGREHPTDFVVGHLTVGRRLLASERPTGIEVLVDLTCEFPEPAGVRKGMDYRWFPMLDASVPDIQKLRMFIATLPEKPIYVHCAQGHGRTGLFAIAYLLEKKVCGDSGEALKLLSRSRPGITLNQVQRSFITAHFGPV
jgi:hypothetical protein